eukprot:TRINITY_DN613_c0_g1_i1.p1 TRINITY_DN613_c0_g1~~TRINITY_DN613_c0_g1_i1.p1  ORF type:complete len:169 (-),score=29.28 TRINITY_DN613_c0_g1_i1:320-826(-)
MAQESYKKETDETECHTPEGPILCANNCGFFGSVTTNNLCSKCYRDLFMKQQPKAAAPVISVVENMPSVASSIHFESVAETVDKVAGSSGVNSERNPSEDLGKQTVSRCMTCRKRVGLTGFNCRCGGTFCGVHRYSEKHECSFDYRSAGRDAITRENPVVKAEKVDKI